MFICNGCATLKHHGLWRWRKIWWDYVIIDDVTVGCAFELVSLGKKGNIQLVFVLEFKAQLTLVKITSFLFPSFDAEKIHIEIFMLT